jgi:hypothetical protein
MNHSSSKGKEIRIPGTEHPITISPTEGTVRVTVAGRIVAESTRALRLEEKGYRPSTTFHAAMQTHRCSLGPPVTPIVRIRGTLRTTASPSADRNRKTPCGRTKSRMRQSPALKSTWHFIPHGSMHSK